MELGAAEKLAEKIVGELRPFCDQIEIAGSIRRKRAMVNDVDLVVIPAERCYHALKERCKAKCRVAMDGEVNFIVRMANGVQIDLWIAQRPYQDLLITKPTNFGSLLLCRTGSREHNIWLIERAKHLSLSWNPYYGIFGKCPRTGRSDTCLASATEEEIFRMLQLDFIPPEKRER